MKHTTIEPDELKALLRARGVCVIIPTYNNCATISTVIADAKAYCDDVLVVNDGSTDGTADTLRRTPGITLIDYPRNGGKGYALKRGIRQALAMGFSYAITMDADGQHYAKDIATLLRTNQQYPGALIVGNRKLSGVDRSAGSSFANRFANFWFYIQTGRKGIDTQSGYRLYPIKKLHGLGLLTSRYEAELELLVFASWHGTPLHGTPIDVYYPPREERVSHFRPAYDFARISLLNTCLCFLAVVYGLPLRLLRFLGRIGRTAYALIAFLFFSLVVVTPLIRLYILIGKTTEAKRMRVHRFIQWMCRRIMLNNVIPGSRFSYNVAPGVDFNKPHIIVCNHQSHFDLTCMLIFHPKIVFVTKDWVYHNPFYGFVIRTAEYVPASNGIDDLMPQFRSLADRGYSIALFPEGTRSDDCRIRRFHQGAFYLADQLGLDLLPMVIYGAGKVLPKTAWTLRKGRIHIDVGQPISRTELHAMGDYMQQARTVRALYEQRYSTLANEIEKDA